MERRSFIARSIAGVVGVGAVGKAGAADEEVAGGDPMTTPAVVMAPSSDGAVVIWGVNRLCRGWVETRENESAEAVVHRADPYGLTPQGDSVVRVLVMGMKPGTSYQLRGVAEPVDGEKQRQEGAWKDFKTLDPDAETTHFSVWNDTHENKETIDRLHKRTPASDFLLWNGDTCNDWHKEEWLAPTLLNPGGNDMTDGRPLQLVWGNHDVRGKWAFKVEDVIANPGDRAYYAFRSGPVACICLHTGEDKPDDHPSFGGRVAFEPLRLEQKEWLEQVIEQPGFRDAPYRVVFCHIPLRWVKEEQADYAKGEYDRYARPSREAWNAALVKWGAQVVVSGHTHRDAWLPATDDVPYAQMVSGGPRPDGARWIEGTADGKELKLVMRDLDDKVIREASFEAIG